MARFTSRQLFEQLRGQVFDSLYELEEAVIQIYEKHSDDFPPGYTYHDAVGLARERGWVQIREDRSVQVFAPSSLETPESSNARKPRPAVSGMRVAHNH